MALLLLFWPNCQDAKRVSRPFKRTKHRNTAKNRKKRNRNRSRGLRAGVKGMKTGSEAQVRAKGS